MTRRDNWGWQARIGMLIVGNEAVPEAEWWAMAPEGVSIHAARVTARAPWLRWNAERTAVEPEEDVVRACRQFAGMALAAVTVGHSSSSILGGKGWDEAVVERLSGLVRPETRVTTNGLDSLSAFRACAIQRPFVVFPPWFGDDTVKAGVAYFTAQGFAPAGHLRYDPGRGWRDIEPSQLYANDMGFHQEIEPLYRQIRAACPPAADAVYIAGTGFRCVGILAALERDLGRPALSANQVSLWHCLKLAGIKPRIEGYGQLLAG